MTRPPQHGLNAAKTLSPEQLFGKACIDCGTSEPPLHPGETIEVRVAVGVVRDVVTVRCTGCLLASRGTVVLASSSPEAQR